MTPTDVNLDVPNGWRRLVYAEDQPEYLPLPVLRSSGSSGDVLSRWRLSWRERLRLIFGADVFLVLLTFHSPLQPMKLMVGPPEFEQPES